MCDSTKLSGFRSAFYDEVLIELKIYVYIYIWRAGGIIVIVTVATVFMSKQELTEVKTEYQ